MLPKVTQGAGILGSPTLITPGPIVCASGLPLAGDSPCWGLCECLRKAAISSLPAQQPHLLQVKSSQLQPLATSALHQPGYSTLICQAPKQGFVVSNVAGRETWTLFPY